MTSDIAVVRRLEKLYQTGKMSVPQTRAVLVYVEGLLKGIIAKLGFSAQNFQCAYLPGGCDGSGMILGSYDRNQHPHPVKLGGNGLPENFTVFHAFCEFAKTFHDHHSRLEQPLKACTTGLARMGMIDYAPVARPGAKRRPQWVIVESEYKEMYEQLRAVQGSAGQGAV